MDLSEVFDTLNRDVSLLKLHAYGFGRDSLNALFTVIKGQKLVTVLVRGVKLFMEYRKVFCF